MDNGRAKGLVQRTGSIVISDALRIDGMIEGLKPGGLFYDPIGEYPVNGLYRLAFSVGKCAFLLVLLGLFMSLVYTLLLMRRAYVLKSGNAT